MTTWHAGPELLARYADGGLDPAAQASVETHLVACSACQADATAVATRPALNAVWQGVSRTIQAPTPLPLLGRLGVPEADRVVLRGSSGLYRPWVLSVGGALVCAILGGLATGRPQDLVYLLLAPLIPVLAVVSAYDATEPLRELTAATAASKLRLALLRTSAATAVAVPVTFAVGLAVPGMSDQLFVWLLPALALTLSALVLLTWFNARTAGTAVGTTWATVVWLVYESSSSAAIGTAQVQALFAVVSMAVAALLAARLTSRSLGGIA